MYRIYCRNKPNHNSCFVRQNTSSLLPPMNTTIHIVTFMGFSNSKSKRFLTLCWHQMVKRGNVLVRERVNLAGNKTKENNLTFGGPNQLWKRAKRQYRLNICGFQVRGPFHSLPRRIASSLITSRKLVETLKLCLCKRLSRNFRKVWLLIT